MLCVSTAQQSESAINILLSFSKISFPFRSQESIEWSEVYVHDQLCPTLCDSCGLQPSSLLCHARRESWSGFPFSPSADLPSAGTALTSAEAPALSGGPFTPQPPMHTIGSH